MSHRRRPIRLVEFPLEEGNVLRVNVWVWGGVAEAQKYGYKGNLVYRPVIVDSAGRSHWVYRRNKGIPTEQDWKRLCDDWELRLKRSADKKFLRRIRNTFYPLCGPKKGLVLNAKEAYVFSKLLRVALWSGSRLITYSPVLPKRSRPL